jgi:hypothetical protein
VKLSTYLYLVSSIVIVGGLTACLPLDLRFAVSNRADCDDFEGISHVVSPTSLPDISARCFQRAVVDDSGMIRT